MECDINEHTDSLFTPPIKPGIWVTYMLNDSTSWSKAKRILPSGYCEFTQPGRMFIGTMPIKQYFKTHKIILAWWGGSQIEDLQKWGSDAVIEFYPWRVASFSEYCRKKFSGLPNEYNIYLSCKFDEIDGRQYYFEIMPVGSETVCDSGIINSEKVSKVKKGKRQLSELKKENTEDTPLPPELAYQLAVGTIPHRAGKLYRAKVLLNWCASALLLVSALWGTVSLWGSPYGYAGSSFVCGKQVFYLDWLIEYPVPADIIHWAASAFFLIPALVIMWGRKCFWRTFLRNYSLLASIVCWLEVFYWRYMEVAFPYNSTIVQPEKLLLASGVIFCGIFYAARHRELWGANSCTLSQLKLLAAHYQKLTTVTQEKFWQSGRQSFRKRWFSVTMVLFYCVCAFGLGGGYHIIKKINYWQNASGEWLYTEAQRYRLDNALCNAHKIHLLKKSAEKNYLPAMLDLSYQYLWSRVDENVEMNPNYDLEKGIYWMKRAIAVRISTLETAEVIASYRNNIFFGTAFVGEQAAVLEKLKAELANHLKNIRKNQSGN
ncbi:MAG: hypothetical protein E7056_03185 [Lentisphaerae bacterium]|nr:hypothetical protein [Lentisphaerota bacterium]